jgi:hypothetical protein
MKKSLLLTTLLTIALTVIVIFNGCKKEPDEGEQNSIKETEIIEITSTYLPSTFVSIIEDDMDNRKTDPNYPQYLDSLKQSSIALSEIIVENFSHQEFQNAVTEFQNNLNASLKSSSSTECYLFDLGLGYGKGGEISEGATNSIAVGISLGLTAQGGGGVEIVYDFMNFERKVFIFSACSFGGQIGIGLQEGLSSNLGFSGYLDWIRGFELNDNMNINSFEGPSKGYQYSISVDIKALLGLNAALAIGTWSGVDGGCDLGINLLGCPQNFSINPSGLKGYTFTISGSSSAGRPALGLVASLGGEVIGRCTMGIEDSFKDYDKEFIGRKAASFKMATDILNINAISDISTVEINPSDLVAAVAAVSYGFIDPKNCNGGSDVDFEDDFSDGNYADWEFYKYSTGMYGEVPEPTIIDGRLNITTYDQQSTCLTAGNFGWQDYTIEYDVILEQQPNDAYQGIRTWFCIEDIGYAEVVGNFKVGGYMFELKGRNNSWSLSRQYGVESSNEGYTVASGSVPIAIGENYKIKIITNNGLIKIYFNKVGDSEQLLTEITDEQDPSIGGKFGIGGGDDIISIDNVKVSTNN